MRLKAFKVQMYRPILDSGWVDVDDITVIVGKNESGKTALLRALHKFNPFDPDPYAHDREWPRGHRKSQSLDAVVVTIRFEFDDGESRKIANFITKHGKPTGVEIAKKYNGRYHYELLPNNDVIRDVSQDIANLLEQMGASKATSPELQEFLSQIRGDAMETLENDGVAILRENIDGYKSSITSAVQADNEHDRSDAEAAIVALNGVSNLTNIADSRKELEELIYSWIPTFIYMDDHKPFQGSAHLDQISQRRDEGHPTDEDKTFLMILEMAGLDFEHEYQRAVENDKEQRMLDMADASSALTALLADHWSQRDYSVRFEADGHHIVAFVSDEVQTALVPLDERSKGFQWFFSFDTTFLYETKGTFRNAVILLDEPGLHLHATAQRDLLVRMREFAKGNQLIYTTHMPFMIDIERLDNIRVCVESKDKGSTVSADFYAADEHARFPLQAALGLSISQSLFVGPYNLVVEGVTDFWLLSTMAAVLRSVNLASLDERITITPAGGATKAAYVATMLIGQRLNVVVLFDSDVEGETSAKGLIKTWVANDKHVLLLGETLGRKEATLEDIIPDDFYLKSVNDTYTRELGDSTITLEEIRTDGPPQLVQRIERAFAARGMPLNSEGKAFNKGRVAKRMLNELPKTSVKKLPKEMVETFGRLFDAINKAMPGLQDGAMRE